MKANLVVIQRCPKNTRGYVEEMMDRGEEDVEYDINLMETSMENTTIGI